MTAEYIISTDAPKYILISGDGDLKPFETYLNGQIVEGFDAPFCRIPFTNDNALKLRAFLKGKDFEIPVKEKTILKQLADNPESVEDKNLRWSTKLTDLRMNKLTKKFAKIQTEWDLIHYFPLRYLDKSNPQKVADLILGQWAVIAGSVVAVETNWQHQFVKIVVADVTNKRIAATFFRQTWLSKIYREGDEVIVYGNYSEYVNKKTQSRFPQILNPSIDKISTINSNGEGYGMLPIYPQKSENRSWQIKTAQEKLLNSIIWIDDPVPTRILEKYDLPSRADAYKLIHFPNNQVDVERARRRIAFDEFVRLQVYMQTSKSESKVQAASKKLNHSWSEDFVEALPFELTNAQKRVVQEIQTDLSDQTPMNRLLQGDVGSGKAQPLYSKILTPNGFTTMGEIKPGDEVLTPDGKIEKVVETFPQGLRPVYELTFRDGSVVRADKDHLWKVTSSPFMVDGNIPEDKNVTTSFLAENTGLNLYVRYADNIADYGCELSNPKEAYNIGASIKKTSDEMPFDLLNARKIVRIALLQGILDVHGFSGAESDYKTISISSMSKKFALYVAHLMRSLSGAASLDEENQTWLLQGWLPESIQPFTIAYKKERYDSQKSRPLKQAKAITKIEYVGEEETKCILITGQEHLYITDDFTVTHNTEIASTAVLTTIASGYQASMLAPTDILASQLYERMVNTFKAANLDINVELFTGRVMGKKREQLLERLASGETDLVVGTHTLTKDYVKFKNLGLAVADESHKYGAEQRTALRKQNDDGSYPDMLTMSATPIPRTTAQIIYGDLDVSIVDELPANRLPIETHWDETPDAAWARIREEVEKGHKAYVVTALVDESESDTMADVESATATYLSLQNRFPNFKVELLHGKMKKDEKATISERFLKGDSQILVATSLIEVGLNHPQATVMVVLNANRFGIASLHQIRGRVGRSDLQSYCYLVGQATVPEAEERLSALVSSNDGFWLAEKDLEIRGEGELFGLFQSGNNDLYIANLKEHKDLLQIAIRVASQAGKNPVMQYEVDLLYKDKKILR